MARDLPTARVSRWVPPAPGLFVFVSKAKASRNFKIFFLIYAYISTEKKRKKTAKREAHRMFACFQINYQLIVFLDFPFFSN
jgi:hypothetical protein